MCRYQRGGDRVGLRRSQLLVAQAVQGAQRPQHHGREQRDRDDPRSVAGIVVEETHEQSVFWVPAGSASAFPVDDGGNEIRIPRPEFRQGKPQPLGPIAPLGNGFPMWDSTADGKRFLLAQVTKHGPVQYTVVLNWQAELKK